VATWVAATPLAAIVTAYCLGGWALPGIPMSRIANNGWLLALSVFVFFAKTWAVLLIAKWFDTTGIKERRQKNRTANRLVPRFVVLVIAAVLALAWVWIDLPDAYRVTGQILATAASVTFFTALTIFGVKNAIPSMGEMLDRA
jgi:NADH:ubiquinone oxidoreductase subunit H